MDLRSSIYDWQLGDDSDGLILLFIAAQRLVHAAVRNEPLDTPRGPVYAADGVDMCYVKDCARAVAMLQTAEKLGHVTYNIGSGRAIRNQEIADAIKKVIHKVQMDLLEGHSPHGWTDDLYMDIARIYSRVIRQGDEGYSVEQIKFTREKVLELFLTEPEMMADLFLSLIQRVEDLTQRVHELERQLNQNGRNGSKPPSSNGYQKRGPNSLRGKSG